jgi:hypothetical protein
MESLLTRIYMEMQRSPLEVYRPIDFQRMDILLRVNKALSRLVEQEKAWRIARGLYVTGRKTRFGILPPPPEEIVSSLASKTGAIITETGAHAANILGFSTQNVLKSIWLTTMKPMVLRCQKMEIEILKGSEIEMLLGNSLEGTLLRAWFFLGENESISTLSLIRPDAREYMHWGRIISFSTVLPVWMTNLARQAMGRTE